MERDKFQFGEVRIASVLNRFVLSVSEKQYAFAIKIYGSVIDIDLVLAS